MTTSKLILGVAVATPLRRLFDYLPPATPDKQVLKPGVRVVIPFGRRNNVIGMIITIGNETNYPINKLKRINQVLDQQAIFDEQHIELIQWASRYYHYAIGEVVFSALPSMLRENNAIDKFTDQVWTLTEEGQEHDPNLIKNTPKQAQILNYFKQHNYVVNESELGRVYSRTKQSLLALDRKGLITKKYCSYLPQ